jgi:hypothetical protein
MEFFFTGFVADIYIALKARFNALNRIFKHPQHPKKKVEIRS